MDAGDGVDDGVLSADTPSGAEDSTPSGVEVVAPSGADDQTPSGEEVVGFSLIWFSNFTEWLASILVWRNSSSKQDSD